MKIEEGKIAEWTDEPTLWRDMTPEEKGALLLAAYEGKDIESLWDAGWLWDTPDVDGWDEDRAYRIKPETKRETVTMYGDQNYDFGITSVPATIDTHRITFDIIDGKPDCDSIKMEEL